MRLPSSCLGLLNLRQGSFVIGVVLLAMHSLSAIGCILTWVLLSASHEPSLPRTVEVPQLDGTIITVTSQDSSDQSVFPLIFGPALAVVLLHLLFSVLLIVGARLERPCLLLTWLIYQGIVLVLGVLGAVVTFVLALRMSEYVLLSAVFGVLGGTVIMAYCFVVVLAFYKELRHPPPSTVVVRQPDMVKMVDIA